MHFLPSIIAGSRYLRSFISRRASSILKAEAILKTTSNPSSESVPIDPSDSVLNSANVIDSFRSMELNNPSCNRFPRIDNHTVSSAESPRNHDRFDVRIVHLAYAPLLLITANAI